MQRLRFGEQTLAVKRYYSLQFLVVELFFPLSEKKLLLVLNDLVSQTSLRADELVQHIEVVDGVILVQALHPLQKLCLLSDLSDVVHFLVKDRNFELFCRSGFLNFSLLLGQSAQSLGHDGPRDLCQVLPQAFLRGSTRHYRIRVGHRHRRSMLTLQISGHLSLAFFPDVAEIGMRAGWLHAD